MTSQERAPLYESCVQFVDRLQAAFYCPGHKGGRTLPAEFRARIAELDLNNLPDTDTLHCPTGPISRAEELLAQAYGVAQSFVLVGGSTAGNQASVMSVARPGDEILVQRNAHKSTIAGIIQAGARPIWLLPRWDSEIGIAHGLDASQVREAFRAHPGALGLVALNPTYFGTVADIRALRAACDAHGKLLLVDEAHGPHFHFHPELPVAAEDAGADLVVQSTHKILSGLSQAAVLHRASERVDAARVRKTLQLLQTTSPNFAIMASIDLARRQMALEGRARWTALLALAREARDRIARLPGLRLLGPEAARAAGPGLFALDETKLVIGTEGLGLSGAAAQQRLNRDFGVQPELSGPNYILCILTVGTRQEDLDRLVTALTALAGRRSHEGRNADARPERSGLEHGSLPEAPLSPRDAYFAPSVPIPLARAVGKVCAEVVTPYPPGIPVLVPGERISPEVLSHLFWIRASRSPVSACDPSLETIHVVA